MLPERESRRTANPAAKELLILDTTTITAIGRKLEQRRRSQLRRDLHSLANRLDLTDPGSAALARAWALEVAV